MAMDRRKKKCIIFLVVVGLLFCVSTGAGFMREDDEMSRAVKKAKALVNEARRDIKKEMDKPFILRIFGSLFGMEGNKFGKLKKKLPRILKSAMPKSIGNFSSTGTTEDKVACEGMRLSDALLDLQAKGVKIEEIYWTLDDSIVEKKYILLSGTIVKAKQSKAGGAILTLQLWHPYNGENGLNVGEDGQVANLEKLKQRASLKTALPLSMWYPFEDKKKRDLAIPEALRNTQVQKKGLF